MPITSDLVAVDDPKSAYYSRIVDTASIAQPDWSSAEVMRRTDGLYRLGMVVHHNAKPVVSGAGSCIFIHIWRGPDKPTAGCTAMNAEDLRRLLRWWDRRQHPLLVQLPRVEYEKVREQWGLPKCVQP